MIITFEVAVLLVVVGIFSISIALAVYLNNALYKSGTAMHDELEKDGKKYMRFVGAFGESTFIEIS